MSQGDFTQSRLPPIELRFSCTQISLEARKISHGWHHSSLLLVLSSTQVFLWLVPLRFVCS